jgi:hypothetical protein
VPDHLADAQPLGQVEGIDVDDRRGLHVGHCVRWSTARRATVPR